MGVKSTPHNFFLTGSTLVEPMIPGIEDDHVGRRAGYA